MTVYFKQIDFSLGSNLDNIRGDILFKYGAIVYYAIKNNNVLEEIYNKFVYNRPTQIFYVEVKSFLNPHVDQGAHSCFNYYLRSNHDITKFWVKKNNDATARNSVRFDEIDKTSIIYKNKYFSKDLTLVDEFVADNNSSYILNIGQIHSVDKMNFSNNLPRTIIQMQWDCDIYKLMDIIQDNLGDAIIDGSNCINII